MKETEIRAWGTELLLEGYESQFFSMFLLCQTKADEMFLSREKVVAGLLLIPDQT